MQLTKKDHSKKKPNRKEEGHWEGKYWCNCRTRNYRKWLGVKKYGQPERSKQEDQCVKVYHRNEDGTYPHLDAVL